MSITGLSSLFKEGQTCYANYCFVIVAKTVTLIISELILVIRKTKLVLFGDI